MSVFLGTEMLLVSLASPALAVCVLGDRNGAVGQTGQSRRALAEGISQSGTVGFERHPENKDFWFLYDTDIIKATSHIKLHFCLL